MDVAEVMTWLRSQGNEETREGMRRYGIPNDRAFGVPMGVLKSFAKTVGKDHSLAVALWQQGWYETRTLAVFLGEPDRLTREQMDAWVEEIDNWAICDTACFHLFDRAPPAWEAIPDWTASTTEFVRRAGYALIWSLTVHDKSAPDSRFLSCLTLIERGAHDSRNLVKKAVNMALRAIGKRNPVLNAAAIEVAEKLATLDDRAPRWVGSHALRELRSSAVLRRLGLAADGHPRGRDSPHTLAL